MAVRVVMNGSGVRDLLRSPGVRADLERRGEAIAQSAGTGYETQTWLGRRRARVTVRTATRQARIDEARHHRLIQALSAGRR